MVGERDRVDLKLSLVTRVIFLGEPRFANKFISNLRVSKTKIAKSNPAKSGIAKSMIAKSKIA